MHNNQNSAMIHLYSKIRLYGYEGLFLMNVHVGVSRLIEC